MVEGIAILGKDIPETTEAYWEAQPFTGLTEPFLRVFLPEGRSFTRMLDLGCGDGRSTQPLKDVAETIYCLDSSFHFMRELHKRQFTNVTAINGDAKKLPFPDAYIDLVVSLSVVEHIAPEEVDMILREVRRVITDDGVLIIRNDAWFYRVLEVLRVLPRQFGRTPDQTHINMMTGARFVRVLTRAGFRVEREDHFPFWRLQQKGVPRIPRFLARLFATHTNLVCRPVLS